MTRNWHWYIRKTHRYLGLLIGIQFLGWTIGGLYFSWSNLNEIHGDHLKRPGEALPVNPSLASPADAIRALGLRPGQDELTGVQLIQVLGKPLYQLNYRLAHGNNHRMAHTRLVDAETGALRPDLSREEAIALARQRFNGPADIEQVDYLTKTDSHHEYREKPLPAWAITFKQPAHATVYVAAALGTVQSVRTDPWRVFDWLWMVHTMDYQGRDDINNGILRAFSILGLVTILSGFALYGISSPQLRRKKAGRHPRRQTVEEPKLPG